MSSVEIPDNIEKIPRSKYRTFLDTTPSGNSRTWAILGIGVDEYKTAYNPQVDTEKWIIEDNARNDHTSNQKQGSVTQKCYKNDPAFEFVANGDIDTWNGTGTTTKTFPAKMSDGLVAITSYSGEEIEYDLYYDGDPVEGTATITDGVPTFTPTL